MSCAVDGLIAIALLALQPPATSIYEAVAERVALRICEYKQRCRSIKIKNPRWDIAKTQENPRSMFLIKLLKH